MSISGAQISDVPGNNLGLKLDAQFTRDEKHSYACHFLGRLVFSLIEIVNPERPLKDIIVPRAANWRRVQ